MGYRAIRKVVESYPVSVGYGNVVKNGLKNLRIS
jgi:hypothetical protein